MNPSIEILLMGLIIIGFLIILLSIYFDWLSIDKVSQIRFSDDNEIERIEKKVTYRVKLFKRKIYEFRSTRIESYFFLLGIIAIVFSTILYYHAGQSNIKNTLLSASVGLAFNAFFMGFFMNFYKKSIDENHAINGVLSNAINEIDDFRNWNQPEATFRIIGNLKRLTRLRSKLPSIDFQINLHQCYLQNGNLSGLNLSNTFFMNTNLNGVNFTNVILDDRTQFMSGCTFDNMQVDNEEWFGKLVQLQVQGINGITDRYKIQEKYDSNNHT